MCPLSCDFIENEFGYFFKKELGQKSENCQRYSKSTEPFIISGPSVRMQTQPIEFKFSTKHSYYAFSNHASRANEPKLYQSAAMVLQQLSN